MKPRGAGSITPLRGRHWVRGPRQPDGSRPSLGVYNTPEEAEAVLAHAVFELSQGAAKDGSATFAADARRVLDLREEDGVRSIASERLRFSKPPRSQIFRFPRSAPGRSCNSSASSSRVRTLAESVLNTATRGEEKTG